MAVCDAHKTQAPLDENGVPIVRCATEEMFHKRYPLYDARHMALGRLADCPTKGDCDNATVRDAVNTNNLITINTVVHVIRDNQGNMPDGISQSDVQRMMERAQTYYGAYSMQFDYVIEYHDNSQYSCIPGYSNSGEWYDDVQNMKKEYAVSPSTTLNVYIACMDPSLQGTLFGVATFPWDPVVLTNLGGLFLNSVVATAKSQDEGDVTFEHEAGHCIGLWHTFHGTDEVVGCGMACEEDPHPSFDPSANTVGDFCADTPATPLNYACGPPSGESCTGAPWGQTDYTNFMGYGMDPTPCGNHFTDQQVKRAHCWICDALPGYALTGC